MAARQGRRARRRARRRPLRPRRRPPRGRGRALAVPAGDARRGSSRRSASRDDLALGARRSHGRTARGGRHRAGAAALPARSKPRRPRRDRHARAPRRVRRTARARSSRARASAGVDADRHGRHDARLVPRRARDRRAARRRLRRARHPPARGGRRGRDASTSCATLLAIRRRVAVGETGLDYFRDYAPRDAQRRLFERQLELAAELGKPVVIHTRAADDDTLAALARLRRHGRPALLLVAGLLEPALERGWYVSFAGNVTYPKAHELREAAARVPADRLLAETDSPVPRAAAACAAGRTSRRTSSTRSRRSPRRAATTQTELAAQIDANATALLRAAVTRPRRRRSSASTSWSTRTSCGVIERLAELDARGRRARDRARASAS